MNRTWLVGPFVLLLLAACAPPPSPAPTPAPTASPTFAPPQAEATTAANDVALPLPAERRELFTTSGACAACHTDMGDEAGNDVSTDAFWRASMMANAARDPYWQASVRGEVISTPDYQAVIEDKCATCHMPMARFTAITTGREGRVFGDGFLHPESELHTLALDGVSCNLCHQIRAVGFGEFASFSGGYVIDTDLPAGRRLAYGPYPVGKNPARIMQSVSGFIPIQSLHVERSELCATCHTLYTPYVDATGRIAGNFPEQTPYLEWIQSDYLDSRSCQDCHMPPAEGGVRLSTTGGPLRSPFYQHVFVGGNAYMLEVLSTFGQDLAVTASQEQFADKAARVVDQLQNRTATVALAQANLSEAGLKASVVVKSQVGHKFPSGFPARRVWLHFTVRDADGRVIFESGAVNSDGAIAGNDNDANPTAYEPHYLTIHRPDEVQIYEAIMHDPEGDVTTTLLRGAGYIKDNRLLPSGFDKRRAHDDIAVRGLALADEDFLGGGDKIEYAVHVGDAQGPFTVTVELLYQSIGYRWADNLRRYDSAESARFVSYYETLPNLPVVVASETIKVDN